MSLTSSVGAASQRPPQAAPAASSASSSQHRHHGGSEHGAAAAAVTTRAVTVDDYFDIDRPCLYNRPGDTEFLANQRRFDPSSGGGGGGEAGGGGMVPQMTSSGGGAHRPSPPRGMASGPTDAAADVADRRKDAATVAFLDQLERQRQATLQRMHVAGRHGGGGGDAGTTAELADIQGALEETRDGILRGTPAAEAEALREENRRSAVGHDPVLYDVVDFVSKMPTRTVPRHEIRPRTAGLVGGLGAAAGRASTEQPSSRSARPVLAAAQRPNVARMKWEPVSFGDKRTVEFRERLDADLTAIRENFAAKGHTVNFAEQVADEALQYAPSRFGTEWEMLDVARHADPDSRPRLKGTDPTRQHPRAGDGGGGGAGSPGGGGAPGAANDGFTEHWNRLADEHDEAARAAGYELTDAEKAEAARVDWLPDEAEALRKYREQRPEWRERKVVDEGRIVVRKAEARNAADVGVPSQSIAQAREGDVGDAGFIAYAEDANVGPEMSTAALLPPQRALESVAKPFRPRLTPTGAKTVAEREFESVTSTSPQRRSAPSPDVSTAGSGKDGRTPFEHNVLSELAAEEAAIEVARAQTARDVRDRAQALMVSAPAATSSTGAETPGSGAVPGSSSSSSRGTRGAGTTGGRLDGTHIIHATEDEQRAPSRVTKTRVVLDEYEVTVMKRNPPRFAPRRDPPRCRTGLEMTLDGGGGSAAAAAAGGPPMSPTSRRRPAAAGGGTSSAGAAAAAARLRAVGAGGAEGAVSAFIEMADRPPERRTHTEAILPFFSSGIEGFDPVLVTQDDQSHSTSAAVLPTGAASAPTMSYRELFDLGDDDPPLPDPDSLVS